MKNIAKKLFLTLFLMPVIMQGGIHQWFQKTFVGDVTYEMNRLGDIKGLNELAAFLQLNSNKSRVNHPYQVMAHIITLPVISSLESLGISQESNVTIKKEECQFQTTNTVQVSPDDGMVICSALGQNHSKKLHCQRINLFNPIGSQGNSPIIIRLNELNLISAQLNVTPPSISDTATGTIVGVFTAGATAIGLKFLTSTSMGKNILLSGIAGLGVAGITKKGLEYLQTEKKLKASEYLGNNSQIIRAACMEAFLRTSSAVMSSEILN